MSNPYKRLLALIPNSPLQVGEVLYIVDGTATLGLLGGGITQARGDTTVGTLVYFRDGVIEGHAPDLPLEIIEL